MFVGHYGPACAGKAIDRRLPLWVLVLAVQVLDVFWALFVLLGIEKVRIVPGITATNPLDLYYMPYTHGLLTSIGWSVLAALGYRAWRRSSAREAAIVGAAVFSHWVLDLLVHRPDLPLIGDRMKVGLGLWNYPVIAFGLEALFLFGGILLYLRATRDQRTRGGVAFPVFGAVLLLVQLMTFFGAPPSSPRVAAVTALIAYVGITAAAAWLERRSLRGYAGPVNASA